MFFFLLLEYSSFYECVLTVGKREIIFQIFFLGVPGLHKASWYISYPLVYASPVL